MIDLADRCSKRIYDRFNGHSCTRKGPLEHEGKKYCKQHYPPNVEAKIADCDRRWTAKWIAETQAYEAVAQARDELVRKAAAYDRLVAWLDTVKESPIRREIHEALEGS